MKMLFADVPREMVELHGAVSPEVARALAEGIRARTGSSLGISITGLAGPGTAPGKDAERPIGRVYIGLADGRDTYIKELTLSGDREHIRWWSSQHALEFLRQTLHR
jgi:nicotinamide-nucleotide amidase